MYCGPASADYERGFTSSGVDAAQPELSLLGGAHPLPEVEVVLAALWTVASWRGVYAAYRTWANFF